MRDTKIEWCHHTFNPWWGCTKVSAGCANCYAEAWSKFTGKDVWGDDRPRKHASFSLWNEPKKWNAAARDAGERRRVFCASMGDVFEDRPDLVDARARLAKLVEATPFLDWLLLTKRPENAGRLWPSEWLENVWLGTSVEDQKTAELRVPILLRTTGPRVRFLSMEPLLECVRPPLLVADYDLVAGVDVRTGRMVGPSGTMTMTYVDWVIVGGESGPRARAFDVAWARAILDQCGSDVPVFVKQLGKNAREGGRRLDLVDPKGGDPSEWPPDLRVRRFPRILRSA